MKKNIKPIFLFSLPRSGSTLLQKILMAHPKIASISEPWLLLPLCYTLKKEGILTEYSHKIFSGALNGLIKNLPHQEKNYYGAARNFALNIYSSLCKNNEIYFLDKTPRYFLIIPEIAKIFPDAKFIFLFRSPVQIMASLVTGWGKNSLKKIHATHIDIIEGPKLLTSGYLLLKKQAIAIRYEDFVENPKKEMQKILNYLGLKYNKSLLTDFQKQELKGDMGDKIGIKKYKKISPAPLDKWKKVFNTPFRKILLKKYVSTLDEKIFRVQGYNKKTILSQIEKMPVQYRRLLRDSLEYSMSTLYRLFNLNLFLRKQKWSIKKFMS